MCKSNVPYLLEPIIDDGDINEHNSLARYVNQAIPYNKFSSITYLEIVLCISIYNVMTQKHILHDPFLTASLGSYGSFSLLLCYFPFSQLLQHGVILLHNTSKCILYSVHLKWKYQHGG